MRGDTIKKLLILIFVMILVLSPAIANAQNLDPPEDYDQLLESYKDMADIAQRYKELYEEAEADVTKWQELYKESESDIDEYKTIYNEAKQNNEKLLESNNRLQDLISTQNDMIDDLLNKKELGLITGFNITPGNLRNTGVLVALNYKF